MFKIKIYLTTDELRLISYKTKSGLKAYEDLNFLQKILYKVHLKRFLKKHYKPLIINQLMQENLEREDLSYNEYVKKYLDKKGVNNG